MTPQSQIAASAIVTSMPTGRNGHYGTMEAADCLRGVTMQPGGSSRVVSEKVKR